MKIITLFISLFIFNNVYALQFHDLHCTEVKCIDIEKPVNSDSWCSNLNNEDLIQTDLNHSLLKHTTQTNETTLIEINNDGDQSEEYSFNSHQLQNLKPGQTIQGIFKNSYTWADGFHTRYIVQVLCVAIKK